MCEREREKKQERKRKVHPIDVGCGKFGVSLGLDRRGCFLLSLSSFRSCSFLVMQICTPKARTFPARTRRHANAHPTDQSATTPTDTATSASGQRCRALFEVLKCEQCETRFARFFFLFASALFGCSTAQEATKRQRFPCLLTFCMCCIMSEKERETLGGNE